MLVLLLGLSFTFSDQPQVFDEYITHEQPMANHEILFGPFQAEPMRSTHIWLSGVFSSNKAHEKSFH